MAPKNRNPRDGWGVQSPELGSAVADSVDLLEVGPEDEEDLLEFEESGPLRAKIKVIGVGGAGGNALDTMIRANLGGVEFVAANTDAQALEYKLAPIKLQLGAETSRGLGCGANPERGRAAALEDRDRIRDLLISSDMVFVAAGLGGGTGTGAAPVIAEIGREVGALTVAVVTKPFPFEGRMRSRHADKGLDELGKVVDTLITIPNQRLLALAGKDTPMRESFVLADEVLLNAVRGISDLITVHGLVNLDFQDVRTIMNEMGRALMGTGVGVGEDRAKDAAYAAISSPLLEDVSIDGARGVLINITGGADMTLYEVNAASSLPAWTTAGRHVSGRRNRRRRVRTSDRPIARRRRGRCRHRPWLKRRSRSRRSSRPRSRRPRSSKEKRSSSLPSRTSWTFPPSSAVAGRTARTRRTGSSPPSCAAQPIRAGIITGSLSSGAESAAVASW
jgi:cell division protein FtsZ